MSQSVVDSPPPTKSGKKHKKDKKRSREEAEEVPAVDVEDAPKKHKKSKSESLETDSKKSNKSKKSKKEDDNEDVEEEQAPAKKEKKKSKKSKEEPVVEEEEQQEEEAAVASDSEAEEKQKRRSKDKKEKKEKKDKKKRQASATLDPEQATTADDAMDIDTNTSFPTDSDADFPFYTQVHSLYVPFYPCGFDKPLTNIAAQHLEPLLNHYSPVLRGVLLSYTNLNLSERPVQASVINPPTDETPALLRSVDEYAVGFAYLTFDAHMFKPARGKWMEGIVQMQSEGHIGVQCWGRFNASIEAKRLPKGWKWVDLKGDRSHNQLEEEEQQEEEEDQLDGEELQVVEQMHTTGYWTDASGKKISGKVRFRIKNFDVGLAGDYGYLSLEGTFLNDDEERALQKEERELERKRRSRQNPGGLLRPMSRRVPEFSMTKFGKEEEEEDAGKRAVFAKVTGKEGDVTPDD